MVEARPEKLGACKNTARANGVTRFSFKAGFDHQSMFRYC